MTGLTHTPDGFPTQKPDLADKALMRILDKIEKNRDRIEKVEEIRAGYSRAASKPRRKGKAERAA